MKKPLFIITGLVYANLTWQTIVWAFDLMPFALGAFGLVIVFPVLMAVLVYLFVTFVLDGEDWSFALLVPVILFPALYGVSHLTRMTDYVRFVHSGRQVFRGRVAELERSGAMFYELSGYRASHDDVGVAYSSRTQKSSTSNAKHFAMALFAEEKAGAPRAWLCGGYNSGSTRADDGRFGLYGIEKSGLAAPPAGEVIYARRIFEDGCRQAVRQYEEKMGLAPSAAPLLLELEDETADEYYAAGRRHFWVFAVLINVLYLGFSLLMWRKTVEQ